MVEKSPNAFRTISEVSEALEVPAHVLRFWESKFSQIKPVKRGGGRRYYRPTDLDLIRGIRDLLYSDGLTIKGVQKILREKGVRHVMALGALDPAEATKNGSNVSWDATKTKKQKAKHKEEELFELAESPAPAPKKDKVPQKKAATDTDRGSKKPVLVEDVEPNPEIRTLFDDPQPSEAVMERVANDELVAEIAKIAESERGEATGGPASGSVSAIKIDKKAEIKRVLGKLEHLRDRMSSH